MKKVAVANVVEVAAYALLEDFDGFLSHIEVFHPFRVYLCVWCSGMVQFHSSIRSCPIFPAPLIEETVFFPPDVFPALSKIGCPSSRGFISGFSILSIGPCVCVCASDMLSL